MSRVVVNFWGGARAAAGLTSEELEAASVTEALETLRARHPGAAFAAVLSACSVLVDGTAVRPEHRDRPLPDAPAATVRLELLPPFAGGSGSRDPSH